jgi:hypothetical protein
VHELFPFAAGLLVGALLGLLRPSLRPVIGGLLSVALGVCATVVSGEFRVSWEFLLFDIPLVAVAAVLGLLVARHVRARTAGDAA